MATTTSPHQAAANEPVDAATDEQRSDSRPGLDLEAGLSALLVAVSVAIGARVVADNSFLTHLTTGDLMRARGSVPTTDPYSWTAAGADWTVQSWLASLIYSVVAELAGGLGIRLLNGVLCGLVMVGLLVLARRHRASFLAGVAAASVALAIGATMWTPRPLLFGLVGLTAVLVVALPGTDAAGQPRPAPLPAWSLVPVLWIWVQTHGSFPLAIVAVGAVVVGAALDDRRVPLRELRVLGWVTGGIALGAIGPLGLGLLLFPLELVGNGDALEGVAEWQHLSADRPVEWLFLVLVLATLLAVARGVERRLAVPAVVFSVAGIWAVRNIGVAAIATVPAVAAGLQALPSSLTGAERNLGARALGVVAAGLVAVTVALVGLQGALDLRSFPRDAVDVMVEQDLAGGADDRILHRDRVGNFLHYRLGTEARVFVDDRFDFYPLEVLTDHRRLLLEDDPALIAEIIGRWDPTAILWESGTAVDRWVAEQADWQVTHRDDDWFVAVPAG
ncbi:MAG: hypothetical protein ACRBI6_17205 [Acidimicrobiales bacterium]